MVDDPNDLGHMIVSTCIDVSTNKSVDGSGSCWAVEVDAGKLWMTVDWWTSLSEHATVDLFARSVDLQHCKFRSKVVHRLNPPHRQSDIVFATLVTSMHLFITVLDNIQHFLP